ncbi:hypothetical protein CL634_09880 [bacterium]|nr:hypothetical protein [bacterium]
MLRQNQNKKYLAVTLSLAILVSTLSLSLPNSAAARTFNPNNILTDAELFIGVGNTDLSVGSIQNFLQNQNSVLARYAQTIDGVTKKASQIIFDVGKAQGISQRFLLATLEKEQSLITSAQATEKALDWATGYSCFGGTCNEKYRGFFNQVDSTAITQNIYRQKANNFGFRVGVATETYDDYLVVPSNQATANLYIYTPHVGYSPELGISNRFGANRLLWRIWHRYFTDQRFQNGQVVKVGNDYWLIDRNTKRRFASKDLFLADYKESDAIVSTGIKLAGYPEGPAIMFSDQTLVRSAATGQSFLIDGQTRRPIIDNAGLALLLDAGIGIATGFTDIPQTAESNLDPYTVGTPITAISNNPQGKLVVASGNYWSLKDGLRHAIDQAVWQIRYAGETAEAVTTAEIESLPIGEPVLLKDGTFVKYSTRYYLISDGQRLKIDNPSDIFNRVFGLDKLQTAVSISNTVLELHAAADPISFVDETIIDPPPVVSTPTVYAPTRNASFVSIEPAIEVLSGQSKPHVVTYLNPGPNTWSTGDVWLVSPQASSDQINFEESSVSPGQNATFNVALVGPEEAGLTQFNFKLVSASQDPINGSELGKFGFVRPATGGKIKSHNLPVAVINDWKPMDITMEIENVSVDETWTSRRTALKIYAGDGSKSLFYDPNDWVTSEIAAVEIENTTVAPGEVGVFKFTIDPRKVPPRIHTLRFVLKLRDKNKTTLLNGGQVWERFIRVDN